MKTIVLVMVIVAVEIAVVVLVVLVILIPLVVHECNRSNPVHLPLGSGNPHF